MTDVATVNAFVLYNYLTCLSGCRLGSENDFREELVLQIEKYGPQSTSDIQELSQGVLQILIVVFGMGVCYYFPLSKLKSNVKFIK